jgi:simple sugar transport system permease protein
MTSSSRTAPQRSSVQQFLPLVIGLAAGLALFVFINSRLFGGATWDEFIANLTSEADYGSILFVNALVGISVVLFVVQLRANALRVFLTVVAALILGYIVTIFFNLDTANKYTSGEFRVYLLSEAEPLENDTVDLAYGDDRGGELNQPNAREPLREGVYTFEGRAGDLVTVIATVANRRSSVNLQVELLDPSGASIGAATSATAEQVALYEDNDVRTEDDAVLEGVVLPADGVYTIRAAPESLATDVVIGEAVSATNTAYDAFLLGALGRVNRWAVWIQDALTLIIIGLAIALVFRARQFSLGAEGQLYMGALLSGVIALAFGDLPIGLLLPVALAGAMTAGFLWGLIPGVLKAYLGANELVASLMLNVVATRFYELVLNHQLKPPDEGYVASANFTVSGQLPVIIDGTQVTVAVFLVIVAVVLVWILVSRTSLGYEIRMVGANEKFAAYGGINTRRTIMLSMAVSGLIAGLAGAHLSMGIYRQLLLNISVGLAFEGVVVSLLARNNPLVIPFTGLLYAYLRAGAQFMERDANVSFEVVRIIQAAIILLITAELVVTFLQSRRRATQESAPPTTSLPIPSAALVADLSQPSSPSKSSAESAVTSGGSPSS